MKHVLILATLGMILLGSFMQSASAQTAEQVTVEVFVGYLDTIHAGQPDPMDIPFSFLEDLPHTISINEGTLRVNTSLTFIHRSASS
jgi:hypothetical protein